jgi:hypothetical protein
MPTTILDIARRIAYFFAERGVTATPPRVTLTFADDRIAYHALFAIKQEFETLQMYPAEGLTLQEGEFKIHGVVFKIEPLEGDYK